MSLSRTYISFRRIEIVWPRFPLLCSPRGKAKGLNDSYNLHKLSCGLRISFLFEYCIVAAFLVLVTACFRDILSVMYLEVVRGLKVSKESVSPHEKVEVLNDFYNLHKFSCYLCIDCRTRRIYARAFRLPSVACFNAKREGWSNNCASGISWIELYRVIKSFKFLTMWTITVKETQALILTSLCPFFELFQFNKFQIIDLSEKGWKRVIKAFLGC